MSIGDYILPRDRDAYFTIRGYVYQVELTIRRWLDLDETHHLELERGEDIDFVGRAIGTTDGQEAARLLEQVKHREQSLTLRTSAALEALADAVEHLNANPALALRFCYTTNARAVRERPCPFPPGIGGIGLWEQIRRNELSEPQREQAIGALKQFLSLAARPDGFNADVWNAFQTMLADVDIARFADLISRFEWSTGASEFQDTAGGLRDLLVGRGLAADVAEAEQLYQRLFLYVFKVLCEPGIKRLAKADLQRELSAQTLSATDHATLTRLNEFIRIFEARVIQVEAAVASVSNEVSVLTQRQGLHARLLQGVLVTDLVPPPPVERLSRRSETSARLATVIESHVWTSLYGASDTGKSQLALLAVRRLNRCRGWIRLHHAMPLVEACAIVDGAVATLGGMQRSNLEPGWYRRSCESLGSGTQLVIDDIPRLTGDDPLTERLAMLADAARLTGVRILSTSHHPLPARIRTAIGISQLEEWPVPMLLDSEAHELLAAYGAPAELLSMANVRLINALVAGNPLLIALASDYLENRGWQFNEDDLRGLLVGEHVEGLTDEVLGRVVASLAEAQRDLLYRLTIPITAFRVNVVDALAAVAPELTRPRELLNGLLGAWVQRDDERRLIVSPVIRGIGQGNLPSATRAQCHAAVADAIVVEPMNVYQAQQAVTHYCEAEAFDRAGTLFVFLLDQARSVGAERDVGLLPIMWADNPLPTGMSLGIRILARSLQLSVLPQHDRSLGFVLLDLDELLTHATADESWAVVSAALHGVVYLSSIDPDRAFSYLRQALSLPEVRRPSGERLFLPDDTTPDELLWLLVPSVDTAARLGAWMSALESLSDARRRTLLADEQAPLGCSVLACRLIVVEAEKPREQRDWVSVLTALVELKDRSQRLGADVLVAAAVRAELIVYGEHLRRLAAVEAEALAALEDLRESSTAAFLVGGMLGRQYAFIGRHEDARPMLTTALTHDAAVFPHERMLTLLAASQSFGVQDPPLGARYAQQAVDLARAEPSIPPLEVARALAESATAEYLISANRQAVIRVYPIWADAVRCLLDSPATSDERRELIVMFTHMTGYLTKFAVTGSPPTHVAGGDEYVGPMRGVFLKNDPARLQYYSAASEPGMMWMLAQYADVAGNDADVAVWIDRASSGVDAARISYLDAVVGRDLIPSVLVSDRYAEAVDSALRSCLALHIYRNAPGSRRDVLDQSVDISTALQEMTIPQRQLQERSAFLMAVVPAALRVGRRILDDRESGFAAGRNLASVCRQVADTAADPGLWTDGADVLDLCFTDGTTARALVAASDRYASDDRLGVRVLGYLGVSFHGSPAEALGCQEAILQLLYKVYPPSSRGHRQIVLPFLERFWNVMLQERRFQFGMPTAVVAAFEEAVATTSERRGKAVIRSVRLGLTTSAGPAFLQWLNSDD